MYDSILVEFIVKGEYIINVLNALFMMHPKKEKVDYDVIEIYTLKDFLKWYTYLYVYVMFIKLCKLLKTY